MRAFITGGSGFIGSHLIDALIECGWEVKALVHQTPLLQQEKVRILRGDICDPSILREGLREVDAVYHLASALGSSRIGKSEFFRINASGTKALLTAAREENVPMIVHFSSAGVLGSVRGGTAVTEQFSPHPRTIYDKAKLKGEEESLRLAEEGMNIIVIRPGWVYGPRDKRTFKLINSIFNKKFLMVSKGEGLQTPVFISDLVNGTLLSAEKGRRGEIYHLAGREILSVKEMVEAIAEGCGKKIPRLGLPILPAKAAAWILEKTYSFYGREAPLNRAKLSFFLHSKPLSIQKATRELGYAPEINFKEGIEETISWYLEQGWLRREKGDHH